MLARFRTYIFSLSSASALSLAIVWAVGILALLLLPGNDLPRFDFPGADKIVHAFLFFIQTFLVWLALTKRHPDTFPHERHLLPAGIIACGYGVATEFIQKMAATRTADFFDVVADCAGAMLCIFLLRYVLRKMPPAPVSRGES